MMHYFMPVVLPPQQAKEKDIVLFQRKCDPMIITFRSKIVPQVSNVNVLKPKQSFNLLMLKAFSCKFVQFLQTSFDN